MCGIFVTTLDAICKKVYWFRDYCTCRMYVVWNMCGRSRRIGRSLNDFYYGHSHIACHDERIGLNGQNNSVVSDRHSSRYSNDMHFVTIVFKYSIMISS